jgi:hypothetical protein
MFLSMLADLAIVKSMAAVAAIFWSGTFAIKTFMTLPGLSDLFSPSQKKKIQGKLLSVITLGISKTDNNNRMKTLTIF